MSGRLQRCPICGTALHDGEARGSCPRCLLRLGLSDSLAHFDDCSAEQDALAGDIPAPAGTPTEKATGDTPAAVVGRMLGGYEILGEVGSGGMGVVYKAFDEALGRIVALKVLAPPLRENPSLLRRFRREAKAAARLQHPNIVSIFGVGQEGAEHFFVMEYVRGVDLAEHLRTNGPMKVAEVVALARQTASALAAAHSAGIVHRDVTPRNIMIDAEGRVRVLDFGLAKWEEARIAMARSGGFVGTLRYSSPEQCAGMEIDGRTDLYSLGVVLYEMLTGSLPYDGDTPVAMVNQIESTRPAPVTEKAPGVDPAIGDIIDRLLAKSPADRFGGAAELLANLDLAEANAQRRRAEYAQYVSDIQIAGVRLEQGKLAEARETLLRAPARCRHWEWGWLVGCAWPERRISEDAPAVLSRPGEPAVSAWDGAWGRVVARIPIPEMASADVTSDGRRMVLAARSGEVTVWDIDAAKPLLRFTAPAKVIHVAFSHDGRRLVTSQADNKATVWDAHTGQRLLLLKGHQNQVGLAAFSPDDAVVVTTSFDSTTRAWDAKTGRQIGEPYDGRGPMRFGGAHCFVRWSQESRWHNSTHDTLWRYDLRDPGRVTAVDTAPHPGDRESTGSPGRSGAETGVAILELSPDLKQAVGYTGAGEVVLWDIADGNEHFRLPRAPGLRMEDVDVSFSRDGSCLALCFQKGEEALRLYDVRSGRRLSEFHFSSAPSRAQFCSRPDLPQNRLAVFGKDGECLIIAPARATGKTTPTTLTEHRGMVYRVAFSPDGTRFSTASHDGTAIVWDARSRTPVFSLSGHRGPVFAAEFSPDGSRILTLSWDGTARIWDAAAGEPLHVIPTGGPPENWAAGGLSESAARDAMTRAVLCPFSPDGTRAVIPQCGFGARVFDLETGEPVQDLPIGPDWVWSAEHGEESGEPGTLTILTPTLSGAVVWDGVTGREILRLRAEQNLLYYARLSPCGRLLAVGYAGGNLQVWNVREGRLLYKKEHPSCFIGLLHLEFSSDGSRILYTDGATARICDAQTGEHTITLTGSEYYMSVVSFSPDGKRVLALCPYYTRQVLVRDLHGNDLTRLTCPDLRTARWSPDGAGIITTSEPAGGGTVRFWDSVPSSEQGEGEKEPRAFWEHVERWRRQGAGPREVPGGASGGTASKKKPDSL